MNARVGKEGNEGDAHGNSGAVVVEAAFSQRIQRVAPAKMMVLHGCGRI